MTNSLSGCIPYSDSCSISSVTECLNYLSRSIFLTCSLNHPYYWQTRLRIYRLRAARRCSFSFSFSSVIVIGDGCDGRSHLCRLPGSERSLLLVFCFVGEEVFLNRLSKCFAMKTKQKSDLPLWSWCFSSKWIRFLLDLTAQSSFLLQEDVEGFR